MPDAVSVTDAFVVDEEVDAGAVDDAAHDEPGSSPCGQCVNQRANGNKREPAHQHVEQHGDDAGAPAQRELLSNAECSKSPTDAEQRPTPRSAQRHERKRRVASRNQQIDRGMVAFLEDGFQARTAHAVVKRGDRIEQAQHRTIYAETDDFVGISVESTYRDQRGKPGHRQDRTDKM